MTTLADTATDVTDVLGAVLEDTGAAARKTAIAAAKSARWTWTLGQLLFGNDTARKNARRRRLRIKRENAARARRQAAEQARREREQAKARSTTRPAESTTSPTKTPPTNTESAGQTPSPPKVQQHQSTNTHPSPLRAGARTNPQGAAMAGEAVDYETTEAALKDIAVELETHAGTIEMLGGSLGNAGIGGDTSALLSEALEMTLTASKVLEAAHEHFVATQGAIHELAHAAGGVGSNEFHGIG